MDLQISGRVALVTAASRGLGYATAEALAAEGARVVICSRERATAEAAAGRIAARTGADVIGLAADMREPADIAALVEATVARFSALHIVVTNAGGPPAGTFDTLDDAAFEAAFQLTLQSAVRLARAVLPHLKTAGWGRIVHIVSTSPKQPVDGLMLSNVMRAGVLGFTKTLATEVGSTGITVNCALPGRIATDRLRELDEGRARRTGLTPAQVRAETERTIPLGHYGRPEEFAAAIAFLCSEPARYITGVALQIDGGLVRGLF